MSIPCARAPCSWVHQQAIVSRLTAYLGAVTVRSSLLRGKLAMCATPCQQIPQMEDRYELYLETKSWEKAADAAARLKDPRYCEVDYDMHNTIPYLLSIFPPSAR